MSKEVLSDLLQPLYQVCADKDLNTELGDFLTARFAPDSDFFTEVEKLCHDAIADGWMCTEGGEGRRFGRVIEPSEETASFSVDVVDLTDIVGPHHEHPKGEICMNMPVDDGATFDGMGRGWRIYPPGSAHRPTVRHGRSLVLYLLPDGEINFTGK